MRKISRIKIGKNRTEKSGRLADRRERPPVHKKPSRSRHHKKAQHAQSLKGKSQLCKRHRKKIPQTGMPLVFYLPKEFKRRQLPCQKPDIGLVPPQLMSPEQNSIENQITYKQSCQKYRFSSFFCFSHPAFSIFSLHTEIQVFPSFSRRILIPVNGITIWGEGQETNRLLAGAGPAKRRFFS